jgi:hypothetical protein
LLVMCHCATCRSTRPLVWATSADGAPQPGSSSIHSLAGWAVHVGLAAPDEAADMGLLAEAAPQLLHRIMAGEDEDADLHKVRE